MTKKLTKKEMFAQILTHLTDENEIAFIERQIELLENKSNSTRKPTANQVENEGFLEEIVKVLTESGEALNISDIQNLSENLPDSNQRMSSLLKKLVDSGVVEKVYVKRKPYFKVVA